MGFQDQLFSSSLFSRRVLDMKPLATLATAALVSRLREQGHDLIDLGVGQPIHKIPPAVTAAMHAEIDRGAFPYTHTAGRLDLRQALCGHYERQGLLFTPDQVTFGAGAKAVIFQALAATLEKGDEVILISPFWASYPEMIRYYEAVPRYITTSAEDGFRIEPDALAKTITPKTKWLVLNSPGNPTGKVFSAGNMQEISDILKRPECSHVMVLTDEIYSRLVFDGNTFARLEPGLYSRTLFVDGLAKSFALPGARIGWGASTIRNGGRTLIAMIDAVRANSDTQVANISQAGAEAALKIPEDFVVSVVAALQKTRDFVIPALQDAGLHCFSPEGGLYVWFSCQAYMDARGPGGTVIRNDGDMVRYLLEQAFVALVPGSPFMTPAQDDSPAEGFWIRMCFANEPPERVAEACRRIQRACGQLVRVAAR
ncbi:MAG: aminotransferase class I/II-fold pyridoxal phosphate-dependent enzyme [Pseudomonadota bacterium]|nr:aminotransferase class I/II-fold pyridoxal phosphate-dependent enzyme [Pseudomonadota bacterium]